VNTAFDVGADEVQIWQASLTCPREETAELAGLLSDAERERAAAFRFARDRDRYVVGRGLLRRLLGGYLRTDPAGIRIDVGEHGKPSLAVESTSLRFNVSHCRDLVVFAVCRDREIGVDVEWEHDDLDIDRLARRLFTPAEQSRLGATPAQRRTALFTTLWTRKEAILKALGTGLTLEANRVEALPGRRPRVLDADPETSWSITGLATRPGFRAAVAVTPAVRRLPRRATALEVELR